MKAQLMVSARFLFETLFSVFGKENTKTSAVFSIFTFTLIIMNIAINFADKALGTWYSPEGVKPLNMLMIMTNF